MAIIAPFKEVTYNPKAIPNMIDALAPPYDVISAEQQDELYEKHGRNVVRLILGKIHDTDTENDNRYTRSAKTLKSWLDDGTLMYGEEPAIYLYAQEYEIEGKRLKRIGFIARVKIEEFGKSVFRHERTLSGPKVDRLNLTRECKMNFSQVFGLYSDPDKALDSIWEDVMHDSPVVEVEDSDGVIHSKWVVSDKAAIERVKSFMADKPVVIADGHHRYETALNYRNERRAETQNWAEEDSFNYVMMYLSNIKGEGFTVLPTHRLAAKPEKEEGFAQRLTEDFDVSERNVDESSLPGFLEELQSAGAKTTCFGVYTGQGAMSLISLKEGVSVSGGDEATAKLDVTILQELVLDKALGITKEAVADKKAVRYTIDARKAMKDVDEGKYKIAFLLNTTSAETVMDVATRGGVMPQKSTYFYPKLISGLVFNPL